MIHCPARLELDTSTHSAWASLSTAKVFKFFLLIRQAQWSHWSRSCDGLNIATADACCPQVVQVMHCRAIVLSMPETC